MLVLDESTTMKYSLRTVSRFIVVSIGLLSACDFSDFDNGQHFTAHIRNLDSVDVKGLKLKTAVGSDIYVAEENPALDSLMIDLKVGQDTVIYWAPVLKGYGQAIAVYEGRLAGLSYFQGSFPKDFTVFVTVTNGSLISTSAPFE